MKTQATLALALVSTTAVAHPGHGQPGWFHKHADDLIDAAMILGACLVAVVVVRLLWKVVAR
jgi:hypothetical protein